jgi:hypothetical protein
MQHWDYTYLSKTWERYSTCRFHKYFEQMEELPLSAIEYA